MGAHQTCLTHLRLFKRRRLQHHRQQIRFVFQFSRYVKPAGYIHAPMAAQRKTVQKDFRLIIDPRKAKFYMRFFPALWHCKFLPVYPGSGRYPFRQPGIQLEERIRYPVRLPHIVKYAAGHLGRIPPSYILCFRHNGIPPHPVHPYKFLNLPIVSIQTDPAHISPLSKKPLTKYAGKQVAFRRIYGTSM